MTNNYCKFCSIKSKEEFCSKVCKRKYRLFLKNEINYFEKRLKELKEELIDL